MVGAGSKPDRGRPAGTLRPAMSTRKLILLSLACGIAIVGAFVAQLLIAR